MTKAQLGHGLMLALSAVLLPLAVVSGPSLAISLVLLVVASLLGAGTPWKPRLQWRDPVLLAALAFLAWAGATAMWSLSPVETLLRLAKLAWILAAFWIVLCTGPATEKTVAGSPRLFEVFALGALAAVVLVAVERASQGWFFVALGLDQPHPDPDIEATRVFKGVAALVVVSWFLLPRMLARFGRLRSLAAMAALGLLVLWAGSLSAALAFGAAALCYGLAWRFDRRFLAALRIGTVGMVLLLPAAGLFGQGPFVSAISAAHSTGSEVSGSVLHRAYIYDFVVGSIWQRPVVGWGLDAASALPDAEQVVPSLERNLLPSHPHNAVLEVWVETGAIGAILGAVLLWLVLRRIENGLTRRDARAAAVAAFTAFFVISLLSFSLWATWWLSLAVVAGFLCRAVNGDRRQLQ